MVKAIKWIICISLFLAFGVIGLYTSLIPGAPGSIQTVQEKLIADAKKALHDTNQSNWAKVTLDGQKAILSGDAPNKDAKDRAINSLEIATGKKGFFLGGITQVDASQVTLRPYRFKADYRTDLIQISENLPSLQAQTEVNEYLAVLFPNKQLFPQTQIVGGPPDEQWTQIVKTALHAISSLEEGVILIEDNIVKISGIAFSDIERSTAIERAGKISNNYSFVTNISIDPSYKRNTNLDGASENTLGNEDTLELDGETNEAGTNEKSTNKGSVAEQATLPSQDGKQPKTSPKDETSTAIQVPRAKDVLKTRITRGTQENAKEEQGGTQIEESTKGLPPTPEPQEEFQSIPPSTSEALIISPQNEVLPDLSLPDLSTDSTPSVESPALEVIALNPTSVDSTPVGQTSIAPTTLPPTPSLQQNSNLQEILPAAQAKPTNTDINELTNQDESTPVDTDQNEAAQLSDNQEASTSLGTTSQSLYVTALGDRESKETEQFRLCQNELNILLEQQPINFNRESSVVVNSSRPTIASIANTLKRCQSGFSFEIAGYTNVSDDEDKNLQLSRERAEATKKLLILRGVDARKMTSSGLGSSNPVTQNTGRRARDRNNRIDIFIVSKKSN